MSISNYTPLYLSDSIVNAEQLSVALLTILNHPMDAEDLRSCLEPLLLQLHDTLTEARMCDLLLQHSKGVRGLPLVSALDSPSC